MNPVFSGYILTTKQLTSHFPNGSPSFQTIVLETSSRILSVVSAQEKQQAAGGDGTKEGNESKKAKKQRSDMVWAAG